MRCVHVAASLVVLGVAVPASAQTWKKRGVVTKSPTYDAVRGNDGRAHVIADRYLQVARDGKVLLDEPIADGVKNPLEFPPAIHVGADGAVHVAVRSGGNQSTGYVTSYRRRSPGGSWGGAVQFGSPVKWNWQVAVATNSKGDAFTLSTGAGDNVWRPLHVWQVTGGVTAVGKLDSVFRVDNQAILRSSGGRVYFASGNNSEPVTFAHGDGTAAGFSNSAKRHSAGSGSERGFPDLYPDASGAVHLVYGSGHTKHPATFPACSGCVDGELHYAKYENGTAKVGSDKTLFRNLGTWHLSIGLGAVAASDDGGVVVAVALETDDSKEAAQSKLLWAHSMDGGKSWSAPEDSGLRVFGAEGRLRPKIVGLGRTFVMFYWDRDAPFSVSAATLEFPEVAVAPTELRVTATLARQVDLAWTSATQGQTSLERRTAGAMWAEVYRGPGGSHADATVSPGTTYDYRARTVAGGVTSGPSNVVMATTPGEGPGGGVGVGGATGWGGGMSLGGAGNSGEDIFDELDEGGCGCRLVSHDPHRTRPGVAFGFALALLLGRRRRRAGRSLNGGVTPRRTR